MFVNLKIKIYLCTKKSIYDYYSNKLKSYYKKNHKLAKLAAAFNF